MTDTYEAVIHNDDNGTRSGVGRGSDIPSAVADAFRSRTAERSAAGEYSLEVYLVSDADGDTRHYDDWLRSVPDSDIGPTARQAQGST